jgi:phospholipid N-methyltransferase
MHAELAEHLDTRFPGIEVRAAPAHVVLHDLRDITARTVVVSSLPFRSLPRRWRDGTSGAIEQFLVAYPQRRLIQYTYQPRVPFDLRHGQLLRWQRRGVVWRNAPPAWVWELAARSDS